MEKGEKKRKYLNNDKRPSLSISMMFDIIECLAINFNINGEWIWCHREKEIRKKL